MMAMSILLNNIGHGINMTPTQWLGIFMLAMPMVTALLWVMGLIIYGFVAFVYDIWENDRKSFWFGGSFIAWVIIGLLLVYLG